MQAAADTRQECWSCRAERGAALVCPRCAAIQPLSADADLFTVLDLPRQLTLDLADLERRYHAASRAVHPDRFQTASRRERELSLPPVKIHCSVLAEDGIKAAIADWKKKRTQTSPKPEAAEAS